MTEIIKNEDLKKITEEIKVYTEQDLLARASEQVVELYERFKTAILNLSDGIEVSPQKFYIAFKKGRNIADIEVLENSLKLAVNARKGTLDDPKKIARDVSNIGHRCNGDYQIPVNDDRNLEYILSLVKQVL